MNVVEAVVIDAMVLSVALPLLALARQVDFPSRLCALASLTVKISILLMVVAVFRDDWMLGVVGAVGLICGDGGLVLLADLLRREPR
jgi:multicomponent Na+:H+ antiporter subunit F